MFLLTLLAQTDSGQEMALRGQISGAGDGAQTDFNVSLMAADSSWTRGVLVAHHRWCEPVGGFIARALECVPNLSDCANDARLIKVSTLKLLVRDFRRRMRPVLEVEVPCEAQLAMSVEGLWALVARQCALEAFGRPACPEATAPLRPTVHEVVAEGRLTRYVRGSELPPEVEFATSWVLGNSARPEGVERDAISVKAFDAFMRNEVEVPRPAFGWLWP